jgi:ankyrin repeat protein
LHNIKILLEKGLNLNLHNDLGETPLYIAISKSNIELIKLLIKYEPSTNLIKKIIHSEIIDSINKDMNYLNSIDIENISSFKNKNIFDEIQNYNGEIISIINNEEKNVSKNKNKKVNKSLIINNKKLLNKKIDNIYTKTQKILNESDLLECFSQKISLR